MCVKIYVDADASPVQKEVIDLVEKNQIPVILIKSFSHFSHDETATNVETINVDEGSDMADFEIIKLAKRDDIVITQDYGLASLCLGKGCFVLHHKGFQYTEQNIDQLLATRHANAKARRGGIRTKGPKAYTEVERQKFTSLLQRIIANHYPKHRS